MQWLRLIILMVMIVGMSKLINADWCYQESANVSTACGGLNTGKYGLTGDWDENYPYYQLYDGDWGTISSVSSIDANLSINYSKPSNALNTSYWYVSDYDSSPPSNITIPSECWNKNPLQFKINSHASDFKAYYYCLDNSGWQLIKTGGSQSGFIYEEAMWWNIPEDTCTPPVSGQWIMTHNCTGITNQSHSGGLSVRGVKLALLGVKYYIT